MYFFTPIKISSAASAFKASDAVIAIDAVSAVLATEAESENDALSIVPCKKLAVNAYDDVATFPCTKDAVVAKLAESACVAESACRATDDVSDLSACDELSAYDAVTCSVFKAYEAVIA